MKRLLLIRRQDYYIVVFVVDRGSAADRRIACRIESAAPETRLFGAALVLIERHGVKSGAGRFVPGIVLTVHAYKHCASTRVSVLALEAALVIEVENLVLVVPDEVGRFHGSITVYVYLLNPDRIRIARGVRRAHRKNFLADRGGFFGVRGRRR